MKIALLGYGKMGQEIEKVARKLGHEILLIIDSEEDWILQSEKLAMASVAIDFSTPESVVTNIGHCFRAGIPVVVGTTGWLDEQEEVHNECLKGGHTLIFSPNYSIGVNLFFELNRYLAAIMSPWNKYEISIEETHHIHKQDSPSGTAIVLANDIILNSERKDKWVKEGSSNPEELGIKSYRTENVPGTHVVRYESEQDEIQIVHTAKSRQGFALGAVRVAEWIQDKKGYFEMKDYLKDIRALNAAVRKD